MQTLFVYKKSKNCPACATLDKLSPIIKKKYPHITWEYIVFDADNMETADVPDFVRSFPTSVLYDDKGNELATIVGYESLAKTLHGFKPAD